ncbi:MAG: ADOP family duplicated permease [Gemmatimonadaceae bacterium]
MSTKALASVGALLEDARRDLYFALRSFRREPGVAAAVVATFALAIGANAAMVGLVVRLMFTPLSGVAHPEALCRLRIEVATADGDRYAMSTTSYPVYRAARALDQAFTGVAGAQPARLTVGRGAETAEANIIAATGDYFGILGARPALGRFFGPDDDALPAGSPVVVLSHAYWQRRYGGSVSALGEHILIDGLDYTVVGIAPRGFSGDALAPVDLFVPLTVAERNSGPNWMNETGRHFLGVIARVRTRAAVPAALGTLTATLAAQSGDDRTLSVSLVPLTAHDDVSPRQSEIARWLAAVSTVVLFVAIANVATLLLLRAARRRREIAVRLALGAGRGRLARQLLVEGWLLSSLGALAALLVARWATDLVGVALLPDLASSERLIEPSALATTLVAATVAGIAAGLAPLVQAGRRDVAAELQSGRGSSGRFGVQRALIALQVAVCTLLLFGAGLFVRSLQRLEGQDLGFSTSRLLTVTLTFRDPISGVDQDRIYTETAARVTRMAGVEGATVAQAMPFGNFNVPPVSVPGRSEPPSVGGQLPYLYAATPAYLQVMGVRLREGRLFNDGDRRGSAWVVLVNETMARSLWPGQSAIGKCIRAGFDPSAGEPSPLAPASLPCRQVVGVVGDSRVRSVQATGSEGKLMQYYVPLGQQPAPFMPNAKEINAMIVRVVGDPARMASTVQRFIQSTTPSPVYASVKPYEDLLDPQIRPWRLGATLFTALGALALAIASVGLFAVVSYVATQRLREIGIRIALGGTAASIATNVVGGALRLVGIGAIIGTVAALALAPIAGPLLFETSTHDIGVFVSVIAVLALVALAAGGLPAWRAARVNPNVTLQSE